MDFVSAGTLHHVRAHSLAAHFRNVCTLAELIVQMPRREMQREPEFLHPVKSLFILHPEERRLTKAESQAFDIRYLGDWTHYELNEWHTEPVRKQKSVMELIQQVEIRKRYADAAEGAASSARIVLVKDLDFSDRIRLDPGETLVLRTQFTVLQEQPLVVLAREGYFVATDGRLHDWSAVQLAVQNYRSSEKRQPNQKAILRNPGQFKELTLQRVRHFVQKLFVEAQKLQKRARAESAAQCSPTASENPFGRFAAHAREDSLTFDLLELEFQFNYHAQIKLQRARSLLNPFRVIDENTESAAVSERLLRILREEAELLRGFAQLRNKDNPELLSLLNAGQVVLINQHSNYIAESKDHQTGKNQQMNPFVRMLVRIIDFIFGLFS